MGRNKSANLVSARRETTFWEINKSISKVLELQDKKVKK